MSESDQFSEEMGLQPQGQAQPGQAIGQPQSTLTPQTLMQLFPDLTAETAVALLEAMPQLCGQAQQAIQQAQAQAQAQQQEQLQMQPQLNSIDSFIDQLLDQELTEEEIDAMLLGGLEAAKKYPELLEQAIAQVQAQEQGQEPGQIQRTPEQQELLNQLEEQILQTAPEEGILASPQPPQLPQPPKEERFLSQRIPGTGTPRELSRKEEKFPSQMVRIPGTGTPRELSRKEEEELKLLELMQLPQPQPGIQAAGQRTNKKGIRFPWLASTDEAGTVMMDSLEMDIMDSTIKVEDGVLTADATMTAAMVQDYSGKKVLKDPKHLKKSCDTWPAPIPCTFRHPKEGIVMSQDEIVGWTTPPVWDEKINNVKCSIRVTDGPTIAAIEDGKTDVSIGFFCDLNETPGTFDNVDYDAVQENIVYNHLAVGLDKGRGRCPDGKCGIHANDSIIAGESKEPTEEECKCCAHYDEMCEFITTDARLTSAQRKELAPEVFCGPNRAFPVPDCAHYTAALRLLGRYQGEGDKAEIKACIEKRGQDMSCPTMKDAESLHMQMINEQTAGLVKMTEKLSKNPTEMSEKDLQTLTGGISDMMWKLKDNIRIAKAMEMSMEDTKMLSAVKAIGDAAILKHQIETKRGTAGKPIKEGKYKLIPGYPDTHDHFVTLDNEGSGTSTKNDEHVHNVKAFNVELANEHSHTLQSVQNEEETSMSDEDKQKKDAADAAVKEQEPTKQAPKDKADPAEKPPEKDEASLYVDKLIKDERTKLVDAIMDTEPGRERSHYEGRSLDELKELNEFISGQKTDGVTIPAGAGSTNDASKKVVDDAYADLEEKIRTE